MTNYLDKEGLKKFWDITKGKYSVQGHTHDDRYLKIGATAADSNKLGGYASSSYVKTITIGHKSDYQDTVILLWKDSDITKHMANGLLYSDGYGSRRYTCADMRFWFSRWNAQSFDYSFCFNTFGCGTRMNLVTCTYEGEKWWAIQCRNTQAINIYYVGRSVNISWKPIIYYNQNTKQVLNQEIYDSIVDQSDKLSTFYVGDAKNALMTDIPTKLSQLSDDMVNGKYLKLTGGTLTGMLNANGGITLPLNKGIIQNQAAGPNYTIMLEWLKGGVSRAKYNPQIGQLNTEDAITILPYPIDDAPWNGKYGLFIKKGVAKIDGVELSKVTHNHDSKYLSLSGGTLTGGLTTNSTLSVGGAATLNSSLTVKGATTVQGLTANGATSVQDLTVNGVLTTKGNGLALYHATPFIDFHYGNTADDYNVRIWNNVSGGLQINAHTLIDLVGPMKSSGGRLWITNGDTNIYDVKTTGLTSYVPVKHALTSQFVGNVGIGTDADAAYKLKVNGKAYFVANAIVNGDLQVNGIINNGDFYTDGDGWVYTTQLNISEGGDIVIRDSDGGEHILNLTKAIELGIFT